MEFDYIYTNNNGDDLFCRVESVVDGDNYIIEFTNGERVMVNKSELSEVA